MLPFITVVTFCNSAIREYADVAAAINRGYCDHHGYSFVQDVHDNVPLELSHEKVRVVQRYLPTADYVCWIDADACFIDFDTPLTAFCREGADLVIAGHTFGFDLRGCRRRYLHGSLPCGLNGGAFMLRRSPWSSLFLQHWWHRCERGHRLSTSFLEQGQLQDMFMQDELSLRRRTHLVVPSSRFNRCDDDDHDVCEFILHLWGTGSEFRRNVFRQVLAGIKPDIGIDLPRFNVGPLLASGRD